MPTVRKLAPEEVQTAQSKGKGQRKLVEEQYDAIISEYEPGDYAEAILDEGEKRLTVRNRFKAAASRRGVSLNFRRTTGDMLSFQVVEKSSENGASTAAPVEEPAPVVSSDIEPAPAKRKGGRPKKVVD